MYGGGGVEDEAGREAGAGALPGEASPSPGDQAMTSLVVASAADDGWEELTDTDARFEQTVIQ